jgi:hypothetical protein
MEDKYFQAVPVNEDFATWWAKSDALPEQASGGLRLATEGWDALHPAMIAQGLKQVKRKFSLLRDITEEYEGVKKAKVIKINLSPLHDDLQIFYR